VIRTAVAWLGHAHVVEGSRMADGAWAHVTVERNEYFL